MSSNIIKKEVIIL